MNEKRVAQTAQIITLVTVALLLMAGVTHALGGSTYGGVYQTDVKYDFIAGNTSDTRVSGGQQPVGINDTTSTKYCWRLGIFGIRGCETSYVPPVPDLGSGSTCEDWKPPLNRVGLRRIAWVKTGSDRFNVLPFND